ncbi:MAG TPA: hypothetical protein VF240_01610 [Pyrinomonadaceae bacterium]
MNERTKAALIGGAVAGILSAIPILNNCCCLWAICGGILAILVYTKSTKAAMTPGDGAMLGVVAGGIGVAIYLAIGLPVFLLIGAASITSQMSQAGVDIPFSGTILAIIVALIFAIGVFAFTVLGGLIGAAIFGKGGAGAPPPPPPPNFGGPAGGTYGAGS